MKRTIPMAALLAAAAQLAGAAETAPAAPAPPVEGSKTTLIVNGLYSPLANDFDETRSITMFAEEGTIESAYSAKGGPGFDVAVQRLIKPRLAIVIGGGYASRSMENDFIARLPHPLYLNRHRVVEGTSDGFSYTELAGHLSLAYVRTEAKMGYTLFGGPSLYKVDAELVSRVETTETYPYDEVTPRLVTEKQGKTAPGFHVGASLSRAMSPRLSIGLQARYGLGSAKIQLNDKDEATKVKAGGLQIGLGLRFAL
jgi:opacity protein-like surface antigen